MKSKQKKVCIFSLLVLFLAVVIQAQEKPVLSILPFTGPNIQKDELNTIEYLIQSYVSQLNKFQLLGTEDRDKILAELDFNNDTNNLTPSYMGNALSANFLLTGNLSRLNQDLILTLEVINVNNGEKASSSNIYKNMSELALDSQVLVRQLFSQEKEETNLPDTKLATSIRIESLYGLWQGDTGVEYVRVLSGNRALAILSSGAQMELSWQINGDNVEFVQVSENILKFFHPAPYAIAVQLVELADPVKWVFKITENGKTLTGLKYGTAVRYEKDIILEVYHNKSREALWHKSSK